MKNICKSTIRIFIAGMIIMMAFNARKVAETNAYLFDDAKFPGVNVSAGYWIPTVRINVNPENANGEYESAPCVTLSADINGDPDGINIFYKFDSSDLSDDAIEYNSGECITPEEGEHTIYVQAVNEENEDWKSSMISKSFKVNAEEEEIETKKVIINEVMWMGSKDTPEKRYDGPKDQWVELKVLAEEGIQLKDWYLTYKKNSDGKEKTIITIKDNRIIKEGEFFLMTYYSKNNSAIDVNPDSDDMYNFDINNFQLKLYNAQGELMDVAGSGSGKPTVGDEDDFYSMERNDKPGEGSDYANWHACEDASSTELYWDEDRIERGTPGHENLSDNDPSTKKKNKEKVEEPVPPEETPIIIEPETVVNNESVEGTREEVEILERDTKDTEDVGEETKSDSEDGVIVKSDDESKEEERGEDICDTKDIEDIEKEYKPNGEENDVEEAIETEETKEIKKIEETQDEKKVAETQEVKKEDDKKKDEKKEEIKKEEPKETEEEEKGENKKEEKDKDEDKDKKDDKKEKAKKEDREDNEEKKDEKDDSATN